MAFKVEIDGETISLTLKQKEFCELYATSEIRGNGVMCYAKAYNVDLSKKGAYVYAKSEAYTNLTKPHLLAYIRSLYEKTLNDEMVDNELAFLVSQHADFRAKISAIKEYNNLKARIIKKIDHTTKGDKIKGYTILSLDEEE